jgi:hypothetical protein
LTLLETSGERESIADAAAHLLVALEADWLI